MAQDAAVTDVEGTSVRQPPWHALEPDEVADRLGVDPARGLSSDDAARRLDEHGPNELATEQPRSDLDILLSQFFAGAVAAALTVHIAASYWGSTPAILRFEPVTGAGWARIALVVLVVIAVSELHKWLRSRRRLGPWV